MTRKEYMDSLTGKPDAERWTMHREYYAQFVGPSTLDSVRYLLPRLQASTDKHFNDTTSLITWDRCCLPTPPDPHLRKEAYSSPSTRVCILKEAARQLLEQQED